MKPNVLFLCTGNSARSQLGEAILKELAGDRFNVYSAGLEPKGVHPLTIKVLDEIGVDIHDAKSKGVREFLGKLPVHHLIIVCSGADHACPTVWPGLLQRHVMPFDDPAAAEGSEAEKLRVFRRVRDEIREKLTEWVEAQSAVA